MVIMQKFNPRNNAYVKMKMTSKGVQFLDVKQREPLKPFKGVKIIKNK